MRSLIPWLSVLAIALTSLADPYTEITPDLGPVVPSSTTDSLFEILWYTNVQGTTTSQLLLSACYAGDYYFIAGSGLSSGDPADNKIYKIDSDGNLVAMYNQPNVNSGWGFRDLCYDGTYLYAGCEAAEVYAFDLNGNMMPSMNVPKPLSASVVRALAYDPDTDHFWTGNFGSPIFEFDRFGTVIWSGSSSLTGVYGMAWDDVSLGCPWLWISDQSGNPAFTMKKFDPIAHQVVASYQLPNLPGITSSTAGGIEGSTEWGLGFFVIVALVQGTPWDYLVVYEVVPGELPYAFITLTPVSPPIVIPPAGGNFSYNAILSNPIPSTTTFDVWIMVTLPNGSQIGPVLGPLSVTLPALAILTRLRAQTVPSTAPAGIYTYLGVAGIYPNQVYNTSSFTFSKSGLDKSDGEMVWFEHGETFAAEISNEFSLHNYPNPFNPTTSIRYTLACAGDVNLTIYDLSGRQVAQLVKGYRDTGSHQVTFDGSILASGVYIYRLNSVGQTTAAKMVLTK